MASEPMEGELKLAPARPDGGVQAEQSFKSSMAGMVGAVEGADESIL